MKCFLCLCFLAFAPALHADSGGNPAGIILYAEEEDGIYLLLADHMAPSRRGWAAFGGAHEEGESVAETAARETEEETRGFFKREKLLEAIDGRNPLFDGPFAFYFVKVEKAPIADIAGSQIPPDKSAFRERGPYAWIPYSEIERLLRTDEVKLKPTFLPKDRHTDWIWPVWLHNLSVAIEAKALPWRESQLKRTR